jgi:hypothetical protein
MSIITGATVLQLRKEKRALRSKLAEITKAERELASKRKDVVSTLEGITGMLNGFMNGRALPGNARSVRKLAQTGTKKKVVRPATSRMPRGTAVEWVVEVLGRLKTGVTTAQMLRTARHRMPMCLREDKSLFTDDWKLQARLSANCKTGIKKGLIQANQKKGVSGRVLNYNLTQEGHKLWMSLQKQEKKLTS